MSFLTGSRPLPERAATQMSPTPYPALSPGSFAHVDLNNAESSLQSIAVLATSDMIASLSSELPVDVFTIEGQRSVAVPLPRHLEDPSGDGHGLADWCYQAMMSWLLRGNLYGDVLERAPTGQPTQVMLHHPDEVAGWLEDGTPRWSVNGRLVVDPATFLHNRVHPVPGRVQGLSPVQFAASTIGLSISATRFGQQWFADGAHPSAMLTNDEAEIDNPTARKVKDRFMAALFGTREPVVLGKGWKYEAIQVTAEESQFLKTQGYTEAQCARIFGPGFAEMLGYESGGSMTYSNVESRSTFLLVYSMNKWLLRMDRLLTSMLPRGQFAKLNRAALLQSTTLDRYKAHALALSHRWKTVNEVRAVEDMPRVAWGDKPNEGGPKALPGGDDDDKDEDGPQ